MRTIHALQVLAAFAAISGASAQERIPITKERPVPPVMPGAVTYEMDAIQLPTFSIAAYAFMSDSNLVAHMSTGDSLEITLANLATVRATNPRVREYAALLSNEHSTHLDTTVRLASRTWPAPLPDDPEAARMRTMLAWLDNTPAGPAWDAAFLRFQVAHHQNEFDIVNANIKTAHDADLTIHMQRTLTSLTKHRDLARSLMTTLGVM